MILEINNIVRLYNAKAPIGITFVTNKENGKISKIEANSATVNWTHHDGSNSVEDIPIPISELDNGKYAIQKKVGDNDWIDKDGNHYNDAGDKQ